MEKRNMLGEDASNKQGHQQQQQQQQGGDELQGGTAMQDFSIDELCEIFEDDSAGVDLMFDGEALSFEETGSQPQRGSQPSSVQSKDNPTGDTTGSTDNTQSTKPPAKNRGKRRRQSIKIDIDRGLPPPSWHSEAADKQHRQSMVLEM